jgi:hypothetical protein
MKNKVWEYASNKNDNLSKLVEKDNTIVMTNPEMAKYLISLVGNDDGDIWLDPCAGDKAFYNNFPVNVISRYCEINEGIDFFDYNESVDIIISNPPFVPRKLFWNFMVHSMKIASKKIYWLINISSLNVFTPKRLNEMQDKNWYINSFHIVSDKRWFGRYCLVEISHINNNFLNWCNKGF